MDNELKELLTCINENLKAVVANQAMIYCRVAEIEGRLRQDIDSGDRRE